MISQCDGENSRNLLYYNVYLLMFCNGLQKKVLCLWKGSLAAGAEAGENIHLKAAGTNPAQSAAAESSHQPAAAWPPCDQLGSWDCLFSSRGDWGGDMITFFKHREIAAKWKGQTVLRPWELMDLNCETGAPSSVTVRAGKLGGLIA